MSEVERPGIEGVIVERPAPGLYIHTGVPWPEEELRRRGLPIAGRPRPVDVVGEVIADDEITPSPPAPSPGPGSPAAAP